MCVWYCKINGKHRKGHTNNHIRNPGVTDSICYTSDKLSRTYLIGKSFVAKTMYTNEMRILLNLEQLDIIPSNDYIIKGQVILKIFVHYSFSSLL